MVYGDTDECAGGVTVTLNGTNTKTKTTTDNFGDFEFKGLPGNAEYTVKIEAAAYRIPKLHAKTQRDVCLGVVKLMKKA